LLSAIETSRPLCSRAVPERVVMTAGLLIQHP
jgi:hypothetical protein